jgi:hypothetical protein
MSRDFAWQGAQVPLDDNKNSNSSRKHEARHFEAKTHALTNRDLRQVVHSKFPCISNVLENSPDFSLTQ